MALCNATSAGVIYWFYFPSKLLSYHYVSHKLSPIHHSAMFAFPQDLFMWVVGRERLWYLISDWYSDTVTPRVVEYHDTKLRVLCDQTCENVMSSFLKKKQIKLEFTYTSFRRHSRNSSAQVWKFEHIPLWVQYVWWIEYITETGVGEFAALQLP